MQVKELKTLFDAGCLVSAIITPIPMFKTYQLIFKQKKGPDIILESQRDNIREFKSTDAAINTARGIGFRQITFEG